MQNNFSDLSYHLLFNVSCFLGERGGGFSKWVPV